MMLMPCFSAGSRDGCVKLWQCGKEFKSLEPLFSVPVVSAKKEKEKLE